MDLAQFAGADYLDIELAGKKYRVAELTLGEWAPIQAWIKANVPGPLASLASPDFRALPPEVKREVLGIALDKDRQEWPPRISSRGWFLALDHPGGHAVLLLALLGKCQAVTEAECQAIVDAAGFDQILPVVMAGLGLFGPKSPAPDPSTTTTRKRPGATKRTTSAKSRTSSPKRGAGPAPTSSA